MLAANGVNNIFVPARGILTTPAASAVLRATDIEGGILLTASHNPGGPDEDFGIKYNLAQGQPADESFTNAVYEESLQIQHYKIVEDNVKLDLNVPVGTTYTIGDSTVTIMDPFEDYVAVLQQCFDFDKLRALASRDDFSMVFDGMHGAGGPFAERVLVHELGLPASTLFRCNPLPDFGKGHPDPNLTYAAELVAKMGLLQDTSPNSEATNVPTLGVANDGDGDRNLICGASCFVTPSDSLAILCDSWRALPHFAGGPKGVARSMPSSGALDVVAQALDIPLFVTPTGWKFFGNLMSSKELFDGTDYTPFLCGEESFGTGSDHIREKDGLWAALAWMSIIEHASDNDRLVSVHEIVQKHWEKYGRHYYCRYDYEGVDSDAANAVMDLIRAQFVEGTIPEIHGDIALKSAEEFSYTDPVDGSVASKQGLVLHFSCQGNDARVVFRLSGTGSAGATIRMYLEQFEASDFGQAAPAFLKDLADVAIALVQLEELTGRKAPTVIT